MDTEGVRRTAGTTTGQLQRVLTHHAAIHEIVARHNACHPRVFGSVARGDDGPESDIDFVVDFTEDASILDEIGLRLALSDLLLVEVDVIGADTLRRTCRDRFLREAVAF